MSERRGPTLGISRGICPVCHRSLSVNPSGVMRSHPERQPVKCAGTGQQPIAATSPPSLAAHEFRIAVLEKKLDIALRTIAIMGASTKPSIDWMDASLARVEDPKQIGVPR